MDLPGSSGSTNHLPQGTAISKPWRWTCLGAWGGQGPQETSWTRVEAGSALGSPIPSPARGPSPAAWAYRAAKLLWLQGLIAREEPVMTLLSTFFPSWHLDSELPRCLSRDSAHNSSLCIFLMQSCLGSAAAISPKEWEEIHC